MSTLETPVCTCGNPLAVLFTAYHEAKKKLDGPDDAPVKTYIKTDNKKVGHILDGLGLDTTCCRKAMMTAYTITMMK